MTGPGLVALDVVLFMAVTGAWLIHLYCLPRCWRLSRTLWIGSLLRATGWLIFTARFSHMLFVTGDIDVVPSSQIALIFLAVGDVWSVLVRRKENHQ